MPELKIKGMMRGYAVEGVELYHLVQGDQIIDVRGDIEIELP